LTLPVLIILAVLWGVVLIPPLLKSRSQRTTADSIVDFNYKLDVLSRTNGHRLGFRRRPAADGADALAAAIPGVNAPLPPMPAPMLGSPALSAAPAQRSAKRRRDIFRGLALAVTCSLLLAVSASSTPTWTLQILVDVVALAYVGLWAWARSVQADRLDKVRYMPELRTPDLVLRRSVSS
jgi:hypothetical protein